MSLTEKIKRCIGNQLTGSYPRAYQLAKQLNMSDRTLSRTLAGEGTTCKKVIDEHKLQLSLPYLKDPQYTLEDIADLLGYQSDQCYSRLVWRLCGEAPEVIRARNEVPQVSGE